MILYIAFVSLYLTKFEWLLNVPGFPSYRAEFLSFRIVYAELRDLNRKRLVFCRGWGWLTALEEHSYLIGVPKKAAQVLILSCPAALERYTSRVLECCTLSPKSWCCSVFWVLGWGIECLNAVYFPTILLLIKLVTYNNSALVFVLNQGTVALRKKNKQM